MTDQLVVWTEYAVDALILVTYVVLARTGKPVPFHIANAFGGPMLLALTLATIGWTPLLVLTIAFTLAGWYGLREELACWTELSFPPRGDFVVEDD